MKKRLLALTLAFCAAISLNVFAGPSATYVTSAGTRMVGSVSHVGSTAYASTSSPDFGWLSFASVSLWVSESTTPNTGTSGASASAITAYNWANGFHNATDIWGYKWNNGSGASTNISW